MQGRYLTVANGVTVGRLILFVLFLVYISLNQPLLASIFLLASWALDAVDGWIARSMGEQSEFGSLLDKTIDRLVIGLGIIVLIAAGYLPLEALWLLSKDFVLLLTLFVPGRARIWVEGVGIFGKVMTFLQGAGVVWLLAGLPYENIVIACIAVVGILGAGWSLAKEYEHSK